MYMGDNPNVLIASGEITFLKFRMEQGDFTGSNIENKEEKLIVKITITEPHFEVAEIQARVSYFQIPLLGFSGI